MSSGMHLLRALLVTIAVGCTTGCASFELKSPKAWFPTDDDKPQPPSSVTAVWSPAVLQRGDGTRARGFGGRLMFYGIRDQSSIRVDGTLVVYAYDDDCQNSQNARPSRKYVFTREQFTTHYSKSDMGHSYSVWIPWDRVETTTKQVSLIVRFNPLEGSQVVSQQAKATLPGSNVSPFDELPPRTPPPSNNGMAAAVRPDSHEIPTSAKAPQETGMSSANRQMATATIGIPSRAQ